LTTLEEEALQRCIRRSQPFGSEAWVEKVVSLLGLQSTFRRQGRPRRAKSSENGS
jgi:hypothetical protein